MKLEQSLTPYTKINSKWIKDLNIRPDTIKLLEENIGRILYDINHSRILFDPAPREMEIRIQTCTKERPCEDRERKHLRVKEKGLRMKTNLANTLILDFQPPEL